jgi:DNA-binding LacI/PurR family transcriptional regulator
MTRVLEVTEQPGYRLQNHWVRALVTSRSRTLSALLQVANYVPDSARGVIEDAVDDAGYLITNDAARGN